MSRSSLKNVSRLIDIANKSVPANESFVDDLRRSVEMTDEKNRSLPSKTFKPSSLTCKRGCYYQIVGAPVDEGKSSFNMIGICNSGTDIHVRVQTAVMEMKQNNMDCEWVDVEEYIKSRGLDYLVVRTKTSTETKLYDTRYGTYISFMCDGIIKYKGKYYILEIKTETSSKWYMRKDTDPKHHNQAISYSNSFQIDDVMFVYVERDTLGIKAFIFHVTDEMRAELVDFITDVQGYVERQIAPPKKEGAPNTTCKYCGYSSQCRKDG